MSDTRGEYPHDTRHPNATAGILPVETRETLLAKGWIHESEVDAISHTTHTGRRRWNIPYAWIGAERYYRLDDIFERMAMSYSESKEKLEARIAEKRKADKAIA